MKVCKRILIPKPLEKISWLFNYNYIINIHLTIEVFI